MKKILLFLVLFFCLICLTSCRYPLSRAEMKFIYNVYKNNTLPIENVLVLNFLKNNCYEYNAVISYSDEYKMVTEDVSYYFELEEGKHYTKKVVSKFICERNVKAFYFNKNDNSFNKYNILLRSVFDGNILSQSIFGYKNNIEDQQILVDKQIYFKPQTFFTLDYMIKYFSPEGPILSILMAKKTKNIGQAVSYQKQLFNKSSGGYLRGNMHRMSYQYYFSSLEGIDVDIENKTIITHEIGGNFEYVQKTTFDDQYDFKNFSKSYNYFLKGDNIVNPLYHIEINYIKQTDSREVMYLFSILDLEKTSYHIDEQLTKVERREIDKISEDVELSDSTLYYDYLVVLNYYS